MNDRISRVESTVEQLRLSLAALQQRLDVIEAGGYLEARVASPPQLAAEGSPSLRTTGLRAKDPYDPIAMLSLVGRLLLVLAGGFFLRAVTDAGTLAVPVGIASAFAYAAVWLFMSDRAGKHGQEPNAVFHALAAALIAFPLVVEATTRFKVLSGPNGAMVISALSAGLLVVAWHGRLRAVAWITVVGAVLAGAAILVQTGVAVPFALYFIALGVATLWLGYTFDWWGTRWPAALAADVAVAGVTLRAFAPERHDSPQAAVLLLLLLVVGYFGSIAVRTLVRGREVSRFDVVQTLATLVVSLGGALLMARATGGVGAAVGVAAVLAGLACYGVAVAIVDKRQHSALNFYYYTTLALVLVLAGAAITVDGAWLGVPFALFTAVCGGLWCRRGRLFMLLHTVAYAIAAGATSGAWAYGLRTLVAGVQGPWAVPEVGMLVVLLAAGLAAACAAARPLSGGDEVAIGARFVLTINLVWLAAGSLIGFIAPLAASLANQSLDTGILATVSTGVLAAAVLVAAGMGRQERLREWGWLVYPLLVGIGIKLVTQDLKHSRPATLFIALALYGAALIIAPRLRRRVGKVTTQSQA